jgi:hypothetical protein
MPMKPKPSAKNDTGSFDTFKEFATRIMAVPRSAIQPQLDAEKAKRTSKSASRVSAASPKRAN